MAGKKRSISMAADMCNVNKEWDEALCPICMEHPHNAVLILCSSHSKGCRSYICDTSYRHSNCLDRFRKINSETSNNSPESMQAPANVQGSSDASTSQLTFFSGNELPVLHRVQSRGGVTGTRRTRDSGDYNIRHEIRGRQEFDSFRERPEQEELDSKSSLKCPLCRGDVSGLTVVEEARNHLNSKRRSCTRESCSFVGNYQELRRHARSIHPRVRPAEVDLSRQQAWTHLEHQREREDIVSAISSAMPGAVVLGDYVIENSDRLPGEWESTSDDATGSSWTTLVVFQMVEPMQSLAGPRSRPLSRARHRRASGGSSRHRNLWGENLLGLQDEDDDLSFIDDEDYTITDAAEQGTSSAPRQRRRLSQSRSRRDRQ